MWVTGVGAVNVFIKSICFYIIVVTSHTAVWPLRNGRFMVY